MELITNISVTPITGRGVVAAVELTLGDAVVVSCFLRTRQDGTYFLSWPGFRRRDNTWKSSVWTTSREVSENITRRVVRAYQEQSGTTLSQPAAMRNHQEGLDF